MLFVYNLSNNVKKSLKSNVFDFAGKRENSKLLPLQNGGGRALVLPEGR